MANYNFLADSQPFLDGGGVCGNFVHYALILAFVGSAFLVFLYLWKKGKLDMDEEPKIRMMNDEDVEVKKKPQEPKEDSHE